ncbi:PAS domain-containing protein [Rhodovibrionaceae bacterium A322]
MMYYEGREKFFDRNDLIVSKTDLSGKIVYANSIFLEIADYTEEEVIGKPHKLIRHKNMPKAVFKLLWDTIAKGEEIFAYVVNSTKHGDHYWVIAHVTPSRANGEIVGYHSTRRVPNPDTIRNVIEPLYDKLNQIEQSASTSKSGLEQSSQALMDSVAEKGLTYGQFIAQLARED